MTKLSRRELIRQIGIAGASAAIAASSSGFQSGLAESASELGTIVVPLDGTWLFRLDPEDAGESHKWHLAARDSSDWARVEVPHTWQVSAESAGYQGIAWYRRSFEAPATWADKTVRIEFEAVTHSTRVWLNGQPIGDHLRAGYTTFTFDISSALRPGATNYLVVKADNSFDQNMLPRGKSFDWTVDGGIIRPVNLLITPQTFIERLEVEARPNLEVQEPQLNGQVSETQLSVRVVLRNASRNRRQVKINYQVLEDDTGYPILSEKAVIALELEPGAAKDVFIPPVTRRMRLWHFDHPQLHRIVVEIEYEGKPLHSYTDTFGVRKFEAKDGGFFLNGERVRLMGVERMAGSNPDYGMAEPAPWITHDHDDLKELNCVFTRVHWQQDRRVLNYCDRKGILIQEEVPAWGPETFRGMTNDPTPEIMQNGLQQLREMIARDRNHPSIFAWGLSNEVGGQNPPAQAFIKRMGEEARKLDPHRLLTYASNTLQQTPGRDVAGLLDFISWNEYYESWFGGNLDSVRHNLEEIRRAFPGKPIVISEYGYCECTPERLGGDARRIEILRDHTHVFGEFDCVAGAIFFDYNDYRTHLGDKGIGVLKQRVHGVVDLYGNRKPSFQALRQESSPIETLRLEAESGALKVTLQTRKTIPAYTLSGYKLRWIVFGFGDLPMEEGTTPLPKLAPGEQAAIQVHFQQKNPRRVRVDVLRPTGFSALTAWWQA